MSETALWVQVKQQGRQLTDLRNELRWKGKTVEELEAEVDKLRALKYPKPPLGPSASPLLAKIEDFRATLTLRDERIEELKTEMRNMRDTLHSSLCPAGGVEQDWADDCDEVLKMYEDLGKLRGMSGEIYVEELQAKIERLEAEIACYEGDVSELKAKIKELEDGCAYEQGRVSRRDTEIERLKRVNRLDKLDNDSYLAIERVRDRLNIQVARLEAEISRHRHTHTVSDGDEGRHLQAMACTRCGAVGVATVMVSGPTDNAHAVWLCAHCHPIPPPYRCGSCGTDHDLHGMYAPHQGLNYLCKPCVKEQLGISGVFKDYEAEIGRLHWAMGLDGTTADERRESFKSGMARDRRMPTPIRVEEADEDALEYRYKQLQAEIERLKQRNSEMLGAVCSDPPRVQAQIKELKSTLRIACCPNCECDNCVKAREIVSQDARISATVEALWKGPRPLPGDRLMLERFIGELHEEQAKNTVLKARVKELKLENERVLGAAKHIDWSKVTFRVEPSGPIPTTELERLTRMHSGDPHIIKRAHTDLGEGGAV